MYLTENEKINKAIIESNIASYNGTKRKNLLSIKYYIDNGNKCDIYKDNKPIISGADLLTAMYIVAGILNFNK